MEQQPSQWARRIDEAVAATTQEQLRQLVAEAEAGLERFAAAAADQATLLADSHRAFADAQRQLQETLSRVTSTLSADLDAGLEQLAQLRTDAELASRQRDDLTSSVSALSDRLERSMESMRGEAGRRWEQIEAWTRSAAEALRGSVEARLESLAASLESVVNRTEGLSAALDQAATRGEDLSAGFNQAALKSERLTARVQTIEDAIRELGARIEALASQSDTQWHAAFDRIESAARADEKAARRLVQQMAAAFARLAEDDESRTPDLSLRIPDA